VTAQAVRHAVELVEARRREAARDVFVPVAEEVDGEVSAVAQRRTQTRICGGSSETEQNALTVSPVGRPSASRVVTIVTPVAK